MNFSYYFQIFFFNWKLEIEKVESEIFQIYLNILITKLNL